MSCRLCQQLSKSTDYSPCTQSLSSLPYPQQHATGTLKTRPTRSSRGVARGGQVVRSPRKTETKGQQRERYKFKKGGFLLSFNARKLLSQINRISKKKIVIYFKLCNFCWATPAAIKPTYTTAFKPYLLKTQFNIIIPSRP
jgi:hypothetical protein